ncbi:MAG: ATP-grasp domain-containing protein [Candidatus Thorarchaeota archaeon]
MKKCKVLVTGAAAPGFVSIVKSLKASAAYDYEIIGSDYIETLSSKYYVENNFVLPDNRSAEFPKALIDLCVEQGVDVVLPIRTDDQMPICENLSNFRNAGVEPAIVVTDPKLMDTILNKRKLMEYCRNVINLNVPDFSFATSSDELRAAVMKLGYPDVPVVIKPSYSNGSRGFRILDESRDKRKSFFEEKPIGIFSTLDDVLNAIGDTFPEIITMDYLPGKEYTVDALCRRGQTFAVIPRNRIAMTGGITTKGVLAKDSNYDSILEQSMTLIEGFGLSYNAGIQFKEHASGKPMLLEINPRLQGTTTISVAGGVNIPEMMVQMALKEFDYEYVPKVKWGLEMERVWLELFKYEGRVWRNDS